jgi:aminoglycoside phosphotransferase (APT) family kinase protein
MAIRTQQAGLRAGLAAWIDTQVDDEVTLEGLDQVDVGHSAEMLLATIVQGARRRDVVVRLRPPPPGLLEPYDLERQFTILRGLEGTAVRAPRALWMEPTGDVLGRPFFVMERAPGHVYERVVPPELDADPQLIPRMCDGIIDQLAAVHAVDLAATGLDRLGDGATYLDRELVHWTSEMRRVQRGPLPALERLAAELHRQRPERSGRITLVHGDAKPGNFAFVDGEVSAVFDWEMTDVGDPLADIGYLELMWSYPVGITSRPTAPPIEDVLARYQERSGISLVHRPWYRALQAFKTSVILLVGSMLFEAGHTDDLRGVEMALGIDMTTQPGLADLGVDEPLDAGPVLPSDERIAAAQAAAGR